jgi:hypothetical protein
VSLELPCEAVDVRGVEPPVDRVGDRLVVWINDVVEGVSFPQSIPVSGACLVHGGNSNSLNNRNS